MWWWHPFGMASRCSAWAALRRRRSGSWTPRVRNGWPCIATSTGLKPPAFSPDAQKLQHTVAVQADIWLTTCSLRPALYSAVAPEGSGRTARLLGAGSRRDASGQLYYWQEFIVQSDAFSRHNLSGEQASRLGMQLLKTSTACDERELVRKAGALHCATSAAAGHAHSTCGSASESRPPHSLRSLQCTRRATACCTR